MAHHSIRIAAYALEHLNINSRRHVSIIKEAAALTRSSIFVIIENIFKMPEK